jgi:quercetin dioxygenase-like cupin family protein
MKNLGLAIKRRAAEVLQVGRIPVRVIDDGSLSGGQLGAIEVTLLPRTTQTQPHVHRLYTVNFLVTSGTVEFKVDSGVFRASTNDYIAVPIGVPYTFSNPFDSSATFHTTFTPASLINYFREMAALSKAAKPPEMDEWIKLMARYQIEPVDMNSVQTN